MRRTIFNALLAALIFSTTLGVSGCDDGRANGSTSPGSKPGGGNAITIVTDDEPALSNPDTAAIEPGTATDGDAATTDE